MTVQDQPSTSKNFHGAYDKLIYVVSDASFVTNAKYRFIAQVYVDGAFQAKLKVLPNNSNLGVFDVSRIVQDYLEVDNDVHGTTDYTSSTDAANQVKVAFGREFATTAEDEPSETLAVTTTNLITVVAGQFVPWYSETYDGTTADNYVYDSGTALNPFLTAYKGKTIYVTENDQGVVALPTITTMGATSLGIGLRFKNSSGSVIADGAYTSAVISISGAGGNAPTGEGVYYIPAYPYNLENNTISITGGSLQPSDYTGWASYEIFNINDSSNDTCILKFERKDACKYGHTRIAWWNTYGGWDYLNCYGSTRESVSYERFNYRTYGDNAFDVSTVVGYEVTPSGRIVTGGQSKVKRNLRLHTGFLPSDYNDVINDFMQSPKVLVYWQGVWQPVRTNTSSLQYKDNVIDKTIDYEFEVEFGVHENAIG